MYASIVEMVASQSLLARVAASAADEGYVGDPMEWARQNLWAVVSAADWVAAWDSALATASNNANPNTGARDDVITDGMILARVQPMVAQPEQAEG
jgi:hypothetical protein